MPQTGGDKPGKVNIDKISEEVVSLAAMKAALGVPGVYGLCDTLSGNLTRIIGAKDTDLVGVKVSGDKTALCIDLYLIVLFGAKIPQLAWDVQSTVKEAVEDLTHDRVKEVNIHIQGVQEPQKG